MFSRIDGVFSSYLRGQLIVSAILGAVFTVALLILGVKFALVIGVRDVLPRSVVTVPFTKLWMNLRRPVPPLRGWIIQQRRIYPCSSTCTAPNQQQLASRSHFFLVIKAPDAQFDLEKTREFMQSLNPLSVALVPSAPPKRKVTTADLTPPWGPDSIPAPKSGPDDHSTVAPPRNRDQVELSQCE